MTKASKIENYRLEVNKQLTARNQQPIEKTEIFLIGGVEAFSHAVKWGINAWTTAMTIIDIRSRA